MRRRKQQAPMVFMHGGARVEVVFVEGATRLYTMKGVDGTLQALERMEVHGAIVRVIPTRDATSEQRHTYLSMLKQSGAAHGWLAPALPSADAVPRAQLVEVVPEEPARLVIDRMVDEAHTKDRDRLRAVIDAALSGESL